MIGAAVERRHYREDGNSNDERSGGMIDGMKMNEV